MAISRWILTPLLLCGEVLLAQAAEADTSAQVPRTSKGIQGIFLTGSRDDIIPEGRPDRTGVQAMDFSVPGGSQPLIDLLKPFLGKPVTKKTVIAIKQKIMDYYVKNHVSMIGVEIPAQRTAGGVVQILVIKKRFGRAIYKGESFYDSERLGRYLGVTPNVDIAQDVLQNNLSWLNKNPFHYTKMKYVPSSDPNVLDIEFNTKARRPIRIYARGDNTGSASTGFGRIYTGFAWGNAFNRGDILSFEFETSNYFKRFQSYTSNYTCFLPWKCILTLFGSYFSVKPSSPTSRISSHGWQFRPRYTIPFKPLYTPLQQSVAIGFDIKNTNSSIINLSGGTPVVQPAPSRAVNKQIYVSQLVGSYTLYNTIRKNSIYFNLSFYGSPFKFLPHQTSTDFNKVRTRSRPRYCYLNATAGDVITIPKKLTISLLLRGQIASQTLPSTELFTLGGYNTVRGYHQSESATDNGFVFNLELRTPEYKVPPNKKGKLLFLAFVDYGIGNDWFIMKSKRPGVKVAPHTDYLLGVGPGLRYNVNPTFQLRCDYGFKLHTLFIGKNNKSLKTLRSGFGQLHIGALASF